MKQLYFLLFALVHSLQVAAQENFKPGYIIKPDGSKEEGLLDYRSIARNSLNVTYKKEVNSREITFQPAELQGYGFAGGKRYESLFFTNADSTKQAYFMEVLVKGTADLYFMQERQGKERFFMQKDGLLRELVKKTSQVQRDGKNYKAEVKLYVGVLKTAMLDCAEILPGIEKARLEEHSLISIFSKYNSCVPSDNGENFVKEHEKTVYFEKGIVAGMAVNNVTFDAAKYTHTYLTNADFAFSPQVTAGLYLNLIVPKLSEKLKVHTGLLYEHVSMEGKYKEERPVNRYDAYDGYIKVSYLKMPVLLRYTYLKGRVRPFVNAGAHVSALLEGESVLVKDATFYGVTNTTTTPAIKEFRKYDEGLIAGAGLSTKLGNRELTFEARYERSAGFSPYINLSSNRQSLQFLISIGL